MELFLDLQEEILLRVPLKSLLRFESVSKQWKSTLESRSFAKIRSKIQKNRKILAALDNDQMTSRLEENEDDVETLYLHCDDANTTRPSLSCDGMLCIPVPGHFIVHNPSTGQSISFPSAPKPTKGHFHDTGLYPHGVYWWTTVSFDWAFGFGKDTVSGSYKIVRLFFLNYSYRYCDVLDVSTGEWRELKHLPPFRLETRRKPAYLNGSIYWLEYIQHKVIALDLHTEEFRIITMCPLQPFVHFASQLVNLDDRLTIATIYREPPSGPKLEISTLDAQEKTWITSYSICLVDLPPSRHPSELWMRPLTVSKQGDLLIHDSKKRLFRYCPKTDQLCHLSSNICIISSLVEDLVPFGPSELKVPFGRLKLRTTPISLRCKIFSQVKLHIPCILATTVASLMIFRFFLVSSKSPY